MISDCIPFEVGNMLAVLGSDGAGGKAGEETDEGVMVDVTTGEEA